VKRQEDRKPRDHQAAGVPPSGYSWRFARRVGNVGAAALAGAVNLARIPAAQSVKLVTESI
jgi:hypothetical protein